MPACCVVYTVDQSYLFPTFVSAIQARRQASPDKADILILAFDVEPLVQREFGAICADEGVVFTALDRSVIGGHTAMMARLFLGRLLPDHYSQVLYIDGDTQVAGSLDRLIDTHVPAGIFLAANDPMTFTLAGAGAAARKVAAMAGRNADAPEDAASAGTDADARPGSVLAGTDAEARAVAMMAGTSAEGRAFAAHAQSIGLSAQQTRGYFNTGVLRINRAGWDETGQAAVALIDRRRHAFRFPDQDPLNVAGADCHLPMSLAWNFPIFMCNAALQADINPVIYHYMSKPKPWQGGFLPWRAPGARPYVEAIARYPALAAYNPRFPLHARLRYHLQQRAKASLETLTWRLSERRTRILQYERALMQPTAA